MTISPYQLPLSEISIELTGKCNLTCSMCSVWEGHRNGIATNLIIELLTSARRLGATAFTPCGAEIFMRKDTLDILRAAEDLGFHRQEVVTNGILVPRHIDALAKISGLRLHVSIDGPEEIHDALRGAGNYKKALTGIRAAIERGISVELSAVLMQPTIDTATHIIDLAVDLGIPRVSYQPFQPEIAGAGRDHKSWTFTDADRSRVSNQLDQLQNYARSSKIDIFTEPLFKHIVPYLFNGERPIPAQGCFMPSRFLLIDMQGNSFPCFFMRHQSMGNVTQGVKLQEIWEGNGRKMLQKIALEKRCPGCLAACSDIASLGMVNG